MIFKVTVLAAIITLIAPALTKAQTSSPQTRPARPDPVLREMQRQVEMQIIEKALTEEGPRRVHRYAPLVLEQIKSDFLGIQVIDRKLTQATSTPGSLDVKIVLAYAKEIGKLSKRLKKNLSLTIPSIPSEEQPVVEATEESLKHAALRLSKLIDHLVTNPMFEQSKLVDTQLSAQALSDLEAITELSREIRQSSEKLLSHPKTRRP